MRNVIGMALLLLAFTSTQAAANPPDTIGFEHDGVITNKGKLIAQITDKYSVAEIVQEAGGIVDSYQHFEFKMVLNEETDPESGLLMSAKLKYEMGVLPPTGDFITNRYFIGSNVVEACKLEVGQENFTKIEEWRSAGSLLGYECHCKSNPGNACGIAFFLCPMIADSPLDPAAIFGMVTKIIVRQVMYW